MDRDSWRPGTLYTVELVHPPVNDGLPISGDGLELYHGG